MTTKSSQAKYAFVACALFGLAVQAGASASILVIIATVLLTATTFSSGSVETADEKAAINWDTWLLVWVLAFGAFGLLGWRTSTFGPSTSTLERLPGLAWMALGAFVFTMRSRMTPLIRWGVVAAVVTSTAVIGVSHLNAAQGIGIDVYYLHIGAAEALATGLNPYTDAVEVPDGSLVAQPGDTITGYVYPPVTALAYSIGYWAFDDPRFTSLIAWLATLSVIGIASVRRHSTAGLLMLIVMAAVPGWPYVLRAAWTEPLSLAILLGAFISWRRTDASGIFLGLALASKQYFAVTAPLLAVTRDRGWLRRSALAATVIAVTVGAALLWDSQEFWRSAIAFHTNTPPRPDSVNLVGLLALFNLTWDPPTLLAFVVALAIAILGGRGVRTRTRFFAVLAVVLSTSFLVTSQAFANYWFLVFGLYAIVIWERVSGDEKTQESNQHQ